MVPRSNNLFVASALVLISSIAGCTATVATPPATGDKSDCDGRQAIPCAELAYIATDGGGKICLQVTEAVSACANAGGEVKKLQDLPDVAQVYMLQAANWCRAYNACA